MGLLLSDVHLSELERFNKPCATVMCELTIIFKLIQFKFAKHVENIKTCMNYMIVLFVDSCGSKVNNAKDKIEAMTSNLCVCEVRKTFLEVADMGQPDESEQCAANIVTVARDP